MSCEEVILHTVSPFFLTSLPNGLHLDACPYSVLETQISQMAACNSKRLIQMILSENRGLKTGQSLSTYLFGLS